MTLSKIQIRLLLLGVAGLCIPLVGLELALHVIGYQPFRDLRKGQGMILRESANPDVVYELNPNSRGEAWGTQVRINSHGFRGREYSPDKGQRYRIVTIGDSVTFGNMLPERDNYSSQLEALLAGDRRKIEVLNMGVGGYDALNAVALLEHKGVQFKPDLVVYGYCMNDIGVRSPNLQYIKSLQAFRSPVGSCLTFQFAMKMIQRLRLRLYMRQMGSEDGYRAYVGNQRLSVEDDPLLLEKMKRLAARLDGGGGDCYDHDILLWYTSTLRLGRLEYAFKRLRDLKLREGFDVAIVIVPYVSAAEDEEWQLVYDIVSHVARKYGFNVICPHGEFQKAGFDNLRIFQADCLTDCIHPNRQGHAIIAGQIAEYVSKGH